ncbi:MAG: inositol monophosphatase family protein [Planctomycetaceae bacterium]
MRRRIAESFPNDAILGEEFGESPGSSGYRWILDPVDGTKSFIHGVPLFGTLIGLEQGTECVADVYRIRAAQRSCLCGQRGRGLVADQFAPAAPGPRLGDCEFEASHHLHNRPGWLACH